MKEIFNYIKAAKFFPKYAPKVTNWKNKCRGKNGKGQPLDFTPADRKAILSGLKQLFNDIKKSNPK